MSILVKCKSCQTSLRVRDEHAGKKVKCPRCASPVEVPHPATAEIEEIVEVDATEAVVPATAIRLVAPAVPEVAPVDRDSEPTRTTRGCSECGARIPANARRCPKCRADLEDGDEAPPRTRKKSRYKPCPRCGATDPRKVSFTWWGSIYGPALFSHVRCLECDYAYNGRTGRSNLVPAIIFVTIPAVLILLLLGFLGFVVIAVMNSPHHR